MRSVLLISLTTTALAVKTRQDPPDFLDLGGSDFGGVSDASTSGAATNDVVPSAAPTEAETVPSAAPTEAETVPSAAPTEAETVPSAAPSEAETVPSAAPSSNDVTLDNLQELCVDFATEKLKPFFDNHHGTIMARAEKRA